MPTRLLPMPEDTEAPSGATLAEKRDLERALLRAVDELKSPYRETIRSCYFEHRTPIEIANETGVPAVTVRRRLRVGLETGSELRHLRALRRGLGGRQGRESHRGLPRRHG